MIAMRRGAALYVVGESGRISRSLPPAHFRGLIGQAEKMADKVCELPQAAC